MSAESQESLWIRSLGKVQIRGLTMAEIALLLSSARQTSLGQIDAMKWLLLVGFLTQGFVTPRMPRENAEQFIKEHAKDASKVATRIIELTNGRI